MRVVDCRELADGLWRSGYKPLERTTEEMGSESQGVGGGLEGGGETGRGGGRMDAHAGILKAVEKFFEEMHSGILEDLDVI